jgi:hypothetical protein
MCGIMEDYGGKFKPRVITRNNVRTPRAIAERNHSRHFGFEPIWTISALFKHLLRE